MADRRGERVSELDRVFAYKGETVDYLVNIARSSRILYFEVPKTGCTAVKMAMQLSERSDYVPHPSRVHFREESPLEQVSGLETRIEDIFKGPDYYRFTFVRNPYSRILSAYLDKIVGNEWERERRLPAMGFDPKSPPGFLRFLQFISKTEPQNLDIHWMPQSIILNPDYVSYDDIFRFETFDADFENVKHRLRIDRAHWAIGDGGKHHHTGASQLLKEYYGPEEISLVNELYHEDFDRFGYRRNDLEHLNNTAKAKPTSPSADISSPTTVKPLFLKDWFLNTVFPAFQKSLLDKQADLLEAENRFFVRLVTDCLDELKRGQFRFSDITDFLGYCVRNQFRTRSQIYQDLWVLHQLQEKRDGFFVEVGSCDGRFLSNTSLLEEEFGWTGILCEPNPVWHDALVQNRTATIDRRCIAPVGGLTIDFLCPINKPELSRMLEIVPNDVHERQGNRDPHTVIKCETVTLNELLSQFNAPRQIDYISIDTEGSEFEILEGFDFSAYEVACWTIENGGDTEKEERIRSLMRQNGYMHWRPGISRWDSWFVAR